MDCGSIEKQDSEYDRCGTCAVFVGIEPHTGFMFVEAREHRTRIDFAYVVKKICDEIYPDAKKITIVCDNLNTHNYGSLYEALGKEKAHELANRIEFVYTPKHGSWLDIAEIGINIMTVECLANRRIRELEKISENLSAWVTQHNREKKPISWQFTLDIARTKLAHLYPDMKPDPATEKKPGKSGELGTDDTGANGDESCEISEPVTPETPGVPKLESLEPGDLIYVAPPHRVLRNDKRSADFMADQATLNLLYQDVGTHESSTSSDIMQISFNATNIDDTRDYIGTSCTVGDESGSFTTVMRQSDGKIRRVAQLSQWVID